MYNVTSAIGVKKGINQKWQSIDLSVIEVKNIFYKYRKVYLTLEIDSPVQVTYLDMDDIRQQYSTYSGTVEQLLISIGNASLPTIDSLPEIRTRSAKYMDAFRAGYKVKPVNALLGDGVNGDEKKDVMLTRDRPLVNYVDFYKSTLVSVNGFYHRTDTNGTSGIVVYDASKSLKISNQNQIGLYTFYGMCNITLHSITQEMIKPISEDTELSNGVTIDTGLDLTNKSILFVIGGYLHTLSTLIQRTGENIFKVDIPNYPIFDRFYEMSGYLDTSNFNLSRSTVNPDQVSVEELLSDDNIKALFTMSQSFIVVLDCPEIYQEVNYVRKTGFPGSYIAYTDPKYPLVTGLGRHNEYWYKHEDGQYILNVYDNTTSNRIYNTVNPYIKNSIGNSEKPTDPVHISGAYMLMLARDI